MTQLVKVILFLLAAGASLMKVDSCHSLSPQHPPDLNFLGGQCFGTCESTAEGSRGGVGGYLGLFPDSRGQKGTPDLF